MNTQFSENVVFVIFGAAGDLVWRLVGPALFSLHQRGQLPKKFTLLGVDRSLNTPQLVNRLRDGVSRFGASASVLKPDWDRFASSIVSVTLELDTQAAYDELKRYLQEYGVNADAIVFYLAVPPQLIGMIARGLAKAGLNRDRKRTRVVVEKPLGSDLASFREINRALTQHFKESQLYRMDHFLGKETVQNILAMRFANPMFEPIWNRRYIDHVTITVSETLGVEHRAAYYEQAGALRDMIQNHLLQLMCLVAMEPPVNYDADEVRNKKLDVLRACRKITQEQVSSAAVRGQYDSGWIEGKKVPAYRAEPGVSANSNIETYAAVRLLVDNWRWQDVPFYLRTGKRMAQSASEISVRFRNVPHNAFPTLTDVSAEPVRLVIQIHPQQGIILKFVAKEPGIAWRLQPVDMRFSYSEAFDKQSPTAYETLLYDVIAGDAMLFMRADQVEAAWELLQPIITVWSQNPASDFPNYPAGAWGPEASETLVASDGNAWLSPTNWKPHDSTTR